jgi:hypothetical protein
VLLKYLEQLSEWEAKEERECPRRAGRGGAGSRYPKSHYMQLLVLLETPLFLRLLYTPYFLCVFSVHHQSHHFLQYTCISDTFSGIKKYGRHLLLTS